MNFKEGLQEVVILCSWVGGFILSVGCAAILVGLLAKATGLV